jgi:hypothetical protein
MKTKLSLKITGVRGGSPKWIKAGQIISFPDNYWSYISVDAFEGSGDSYRRRNDCLIEISTHGNIIFSGTFEQLCEKLKNKRD